MQPTLPALRATRAYRGAIHATPGGTATAPGATIAAHRRVDLSGACSWPPLKTARATHGGSAVPATLAHRAGPVATATLPERPARFGMGWSSPGPGGTTCGAILAGVPCAASGLARSHLAAALGALGPRAASACWAIPTDCGLWSAARRLCLPALLHERARRRTQLIDVHIARAAARPASLLTQLLHCGTNPGDLGVARSASPLARVHALLYRPTQSGGVRGARLTGLRAHPLLIRLAFLDDLQTAGPIVGPVGLFAQLWSVADDGSPLLPVRRGTH